MQYTIGMDFGTLSGRAVLVRVTDGCTVATSVYEYPHGVMDTVLPDGTPLPQSWALQDPRDYLEVLDHTVPALLKESGVDPRDIVGIGVDFTSSTPMPVDAQGVPLCFYEEYAREPHALVKLWKHHGAQDQADRITALAQERREPWLPRFGDRISSEMSLPKLLQVLEEAPHIYEAAAHWMEAGDWIVWQLTGVPAQSACAAGYKSIWDPENGFPSEEFLAALDPRLKYAAKKHSSPVIPIFSRAGSLTPAMAERLGLLPGISVAASMVDAHACLPASGITRPGQMLAIIGTSSCYMTLSEEPRLFPGILSAAKDALLPGYWGYDAGQGCVGDHFAWAAERIVPESYRKEARERGMDIQQYLTELAQSQKPGTHGLVALDWWNGCRSVLMDSNLTGLLMGMTLGTKPEDIYRALIEATAYGARVILEAYETAGIHSDSLYATGGISRKNPMMMQIYADVLNRPVHVVTTTQGGALGSAIVAATAGGVYPSAEEAILAMASLVDRSYFPIPENVTIYQTLFGIYKTLHDQFGGESKSLIQTLNRLRRG